MSMFEHSLSEENRRILRIIVKNVHLKHHPKEFITDRAADKLIAVIAPETVKKLVDVGKKHNIDNI